MKKLNIIIIEDETITALKIKQLLEKYNYNVIGICIDSNEAMEIVFKHEIDLAIVDINIKGLYNGIETIQIIQKNFNISVIFLTSQHDDETLKQVSMVDYSGYIVKPYMESHLIREVKLASHRIELGDDSKLIELSNGYIYNSKLKTVSKNNQTISLTKKELAFLHILILHKGSVVSNEQIEIVLWHDDIIDDTNRRQLLFRLRKKLPELDIETVKGEGYILR